jgi:hypothetical protein
MSKVKSLIKGVTKARENLMTAAQRRRARKTQEDLGLSSRRDMKESPREISSFNAKKRKQMAKEAQRARKARRAKIGKGMSESDKDALTSLAIIAPVGIAGAAAAGKEVADRSRQNREARRRAFDNARKKAKLRNNPTFTVSGKTYNTETGRKVETKANGGPVSKIKEKSVSDQVKLLNKSRSSAEKTEKKLRSMGDELDLIKKTKKQLEKDYGTNTKKPVEKANGGMATSRSRKPRGVGAALRGYGRALK